MRVQLASAIAAAATVPHHAAARAGRCPYLADTGHIKNSSDRRRLRRTCQTQACHSQPSGPKTCSSSASRRSALALLWHGSAAAVAAAAASQLLEWSPAAAATLTEEQLPKGYQDLSSRLVKALREAIETDMGDASEREVRRRADGAKGLVREWIGNWRDSPLVTSSASHRELTGAAFCPLLPPLSDYRGSGGGANFWAPSALQSPPLSACRGTAGVCTWSRLRIVGVDMRTVKALELQPHSWGCILAGTIQDLGQYYTKNGQRARMSTVAGNALLKRLDAAAVTLPP